MSGNYFDTGFFFFLMDKLARFLHADNLQWPLNFPTSSGDLI